MFNSKEMSDRTYYGILVSMAIIAIIAAILIIKNSREYVKEMEVKCSKMICENTKPEAYGNECVCITKAK